MPFVVGGFWPPELDEEVEPVPLGGGFVGQMAFWILVLLELIFLRQTKIQAS